MLHYCLCCHLSNAKKRINFTSLQVLVYVRQNVVCSTGHMQIIPQILHISLFFLFLRTQEQLPRPVSHTSLLYYMLPGLVSYCGKMSNRRTVSEWQADTAK